MDPMVSIEIDTRDTQLKYTLRFSLKYDKVFEKGNWGRNAVLIYLEISPHFDYKTTVDAGR